MTPFRKMLNTHNLHSEFFYENFLNNRTTRTQAIYVTVVLAVIAFIISMPFLKIPLSVQGAGIIRPVSEKTEVKSIATEIVEHIYVHEGQFIEKGASILKLRTANIESRLQYLHFQQQQLLGYIRDLEILTKELNNPKLQSLLYQQEFNYFKRQNEELENKLEKSARDFERSKKLFDTGVIAPKEFEDYTFQYNSAKNELKISDHNQVSKWQTDLMKYKTALKETNSNLEQAHKEKDFYTIKAPVSGNIEQFTGIYQGSTLRSGETVAIISPDSTLISEFYISPKDIGYLNNDIIVRIQVDAFNYNEWGILQGKIISISSDFVVINNSPMFRVRCSLDRNFLSLQNGFKGYMKKGMTTRGRFQIAERSLFQLLYQRTDDWLNPVQYKRTAENMK